MSTALQMGTKEPLALRFIELFTVNIRNRHTRAP